MDMDDHDFKDLTVMEAIAFTTVAIGATLLSIAIALWQTYVMEGICGRVTDYLSGR